MRRGSIHDGIHKKSRIFVIPSHSHMGKHFSGNFQVIPPAYIEEPPILCRKFLKKWKRFVSDSRSPKIPTLIQLLKMWNIQRFWSNPQGEKHIISELSIIVSYSDYMLRPKTLHKLEFQYYYGKKLVLTGFCYNLTYKKSKLRLGESQKMLLCF